MRATAARRAPPKRDEGPHECARCLKHQLGLQAARRVGPLLGARYREIQEPGEDERGDWQRNYPSLAEHAELPRDLEAAKQAEVPYGYCVSITRIGRHRKLHHVGSCRRVPGVDYKYFDCYGEILPEASELENGEEKSV